MNRQAKIIVGVLVTAVVGIGITVGVMAAGDVTAGAYPRVATALGHGVLASRSALRYVQGRA